MKCPVCSNELSTIDALATCAVDICQSGCGGVWCDSGELDQIDEAVELAHPGKLRVIRNAAVVVDHQTLRDCPRCSTSMDRLSYDTTHQVEVDQCSSCGGVWLDIGELETIQSDNEKKQLMDNTVREMHERATADSSGRLEAYVRFLFDRLWS